MAVDSMLVAEVAMDHCIEAIRMVQRAREELFAKGATIRGVDELLLSADFHLRMLERILDTGEEE